MTTADWLATARAHADNLRALIAEFHPARRTDGKALPFPMHITAPNAEAARRTIVTDIQRNHEGDPVAQFTVALAAGDVARITTLLNAAWFGVPESTSCWQIPGFAEAVDLLDDPPEEEDNSDGQ